MSSEPRIIAPVELRPEEGVCDFPLNSANHRSMPAAMNAAVAELRTNMVFRAEVRDAKGPAVIPASVLLEDGSIDIVHIWRHELADHLRIIEAEEAARAAAAEALR